MGETLNTPKNPATDIAPQGAAYCCVDMGTHMWPASPPCPPARRSERGAALRAPPAPTPHCQLPGLEVSHFVAQINTLPMEV